MKMVLLIVSMAALAAVMYFYLQTTTMQSANTPSPEAIMSGKPDTNGPTPNSLPYEAQRKAAQRLSDQVEKAKAAQDEMLRKSTGAQQE